MFKITIICFTVSFAVLQGNCEEACLYCHKGDEFTSIYDSSTHGQKQIKCGDCHINLSQSRFKVLLKKYLHLFTFSFKNAHIAERPATGTCLSCHRAINKLNIIAEDELPEQLKPIGMVVSHKKHYGLRDSCNTCHTNGKFKDNKVLAKVSQNDPMSCVACHMELAHTKPQKYKIYYPAEKICANCHNSANKCPEMKDISDVKSNETCTECHPNQYSF
jgi:hypothetical protein